MAEKEPGLVFHIMTNNPGPVGSVTSPRWCWCNYHCKMGNDFEQLCCNKSISRRPVRHIQYVLRGGGVECSTSHQSHLFVRPPSHPIFRTNLPFPATPPDICVVQHHFVKLHILGSWEQVTKMCNTFDFP